jgi:hypothetical protein
MSLRTLFWAGVGDVCVHYLEELTWFDVFNAAILKNKTHPNSVPKFAHMKLYNVIVTHADGTQTRPRLHEIVHAKAVAFEFIEA